MSSLCYCNKFAVSSSLSAIGAWLDYEQAGLCGFDEMNYSRDDERAYKSRHQIDKNTQSLQAVEIFAKVKIVDHEVTEEETDRADDCETNNSRAAFGRDQARRQKPGDERHHHTRGQVSFYMGDG